MRELVIEELSAILAELGVQVELDDQSVLYGPGGVLNSLALVRLIVALEERILAETGKSVILVDDKVLSATRSPFRNREALFNFVNEKVNG